MQSQNIVTDNFTLGIIAMDLSRKLFETEKELIDRVLRNELSMCNLFSPYCKIKEYINHKYSKDKSKVIDESMHIQGWNHDCNIEFTINDRKYSIRGEMENSTFVLIKELSKKDKKIQHKYSKK